MTITALTATSNLSASAATQAARHHLESTPTDVEQMVADAINNNPEAFATHRVNATGTAKSIGASIDNHTDHSVEPPKVNYTATVDDVYSQHQEGDCLPPEIQDKRSEFKNLASHGDEDAQATLAQLDESIVKAAQRQDAQGVRPVTLDQARQQKIDRLVEELSSDPSPDAAREEILFAEIEARSELASHARPLTADQSVKVEHLLQAFATTTDPQQAELLCLWVRATLQEDLLAPEQNAKLGELLQKLAESGPQDNPNQAELIKVQISAALAENTLTPDQNGKLNDLIQQFAAADSGSPNQTLLIQAQICAALKANSLTPEQSMKVNEVLQQIAGLGTDSSGEEATVQAQRALLMAELNAALNGTTP